MKELAGLGRARGVPVFVDLGSGALVPLSGEGLTGEPTVPATVAAGADVVAFSGDKLLGGPQAGIVVGRAELIARGADDCCSSCSASGTPVYRSRLPREAITPRAGRRKGVAVHRRMLHRCETTPTCPGGHRSSLRPTISWVS